MFEVTLITKPSFLLYIILPVHSFKHSRYLQYWADWHETRHKNQQTQTKEWCTQIKQYRIKHKNYNQINWYSQLINSSIISVIYTLIVIYMCACILVYLCIKTIHTHKHVISIICVYTNNAKKWNLHFLFHLLET